MADKHQKLPDDDAIAPFEVTLNAQPQAGQSRSGPGAVWRDYRWAIIGLGLSALALVAVVFFLPGVVTPVERPQVSRQTAEQPSAQEQVRGPSESPWRDAQLAKARREAQDILQKLLEKQEALEEIGVGHWAAEDYARATELAETGDQRYQERAFEEAQSLYQNSLAQFEQLLERSEEVYRSALASGEQAIEAGDASRAQEQFQLAAHIKPDAGAVTEGLQRARVLEDVLARLNAGEKLQRKGELEAARQEFLAALKLDDQSAPARKALQDLEQALADRDFGRHMSTGFAAMSNSEYPAAIAAFEQALELRPGAEDARAALTQARNESTQTRLQALLQKARSHEAAEQWQSAVEQYEAALKLDKNLVEARVGKIRAGTRADVDRRLEAILAKPERLNTPSVHDEYQAFYQEGLQIRDSGPRLNQQLEQLAEALQLARQPVTVQFQSDNATQVTIYRVGQLGSFVQTELTLKPGTYTAVGTREGYRDVRQEFTVSAAQPIPGPITIQCEEKISQG
ncbi:hypothetical protein ACXYTJ_07430 [Gilvimarinus sp. F26214L]|uniref:hypothetical protein n=1 Tax=Gilvimarinus sp. DZF01 TaxID=3461371 RepID=UPI0040456BC1